MAALVEPHTIGDYENDIETDGCVEMPCHREERISLLRSNTKERGHDHIRQKGSQIKKKMHSSSDVDRMPPVHNPLKVQSSSKDSGIETGSTVSFHGMEVSKRPSVIMKDIGIDACYFYGNDRESQTDYETVSAVSHHCKHSFKHPFHNKKMIQAIKKHLIHVYRNKPIEESLGDSNCPAYKTPMMVKKKANCKEPFHKPAMLFKENSLTRFVIEGEAQIGKTTLCQKMGLDWAENKKTQRYIALLFVLDLTKTEIGDTLASIIKRQLLSDFEIDLGKLAKFLSKNKTKIGLVLDGLDGYDENISQEITEIIEFKKMTRTKVIMTTRPGNQKVTKQKVKVEILGLTRKNATNLAEEYFRRNTDYQLETNTWQRFNKRFEKLPITITRNPMLVLRICHMLSEEPGLTYTELYKGILEELIGWDTIREENDRDIVLALGEYVYSVIFEKKKLERPLFPITPDPEMKAFAMALYVVTMSTNETNENIFQTLISSCDKVHKLLQTKTTLKFICGLNFDMMKQICSTFQRFLTTDEAAFQLFEGYLDCLTEAKQTSGDIPDCIVENKILDKEKLEKMSHEKHIAIKFHPTRIKDEKMQISLAGKLSRQLGYRLESFQTVRGYSLSGVCMKYEVILEPKERKQVESFILSEMQNVPDLKYLNIEDIVHIKEVNELTPLPCLDPQCWPCITVKSQDGGSLPSSQTVGLLLQSKDADSKIFGITCSHGNDFSGKDIETHAYSENNKEDFVFGSQWEKVYDIPEQGTADRKPFVDVLAIEMKNEAVQRIRKPPRDQGNSITINAVKKIQCIGNDMFFEGFESFVGLNVQKVGAATNLTQGWIKNCGSFESTLNGNKIWLKDVIITTQVGRDTSENGNVSGAPVAEQVKTSKDKNDVNPPEQLLTMKGDSGAIWTTCPEEGQTEVKAISMHCYSSGGDSVSFPVCTAIEKLEEKRSIKLMSIPTPIYEPQDICSGSDRDPSEDGTIKEADKEAVEGAVGGLTEQFKRNSPCQRSISLPKSKSKVQEEEFVRGENTRPNSMVFDWL